MGRPLVGKSADTLAAQYRTGSWLQAVMPFAGNVGFWWWLWIDDQNRWPQLGAIVLRFRAAFDPRDQGYHANFPRIVKRGDFTAKIYGMASDTHHCYYAWWSGADRDLNVVPCWQRR